ncbi:hypothetical protein [Bacillus sp. FJAT-27251]|uniref:hypothetical protein n=1 Tax=Bacillus sp. FJAT-27251 TaxID=1684142 RepID=UPI000B213FC9|nr:hypothetical protein [Bacillus sp. FJAT-27251]
MKNRRAARVILAGTISGIMLGLFLKLVEEMTGLRVYTLLLNVDYIPVLKAIPLPETIEFLLHLLVSIILSFCLAVFLSAKSWSPRRDGWFVFAFCIFIGLLLFPTTALSDRTPELGSLPALVFWLIGHALYGALLALLLKK